MPGGASHPWLKPAVFTGGLVPVATIVLRGIRSELGADPIAQALNQLGLMALVFLIATLACTPLKTLTGVTWPLRIRRMLGLFAFFYVLCHFAIFLYYDNALDWPALVKDLTKRPFIIAGFLAFVLLIPLAITSTAGWIRRLGGKNWQRLHRLVYVAALGGIIHYYWLVKSDVREPLLYFGIWLVLMLFRLGVSISKRIKRSAAPARA